MTTDLQILPIPADVLDRLRRDGDAFGRPPTEYVAEGEEPLRCCLAQARPGAVIGLLSYSPTPVPGPWQEVGPVFVHLQDCGGRDPRAGLPGWARTGPRVLRAYRADGSLDYTATVVVPDGGDVEAALREALDHPGVVEVHGRAVEPQCFTFAARSAAGPPSAE